MDIVSLKKRPAFLSLRKVAQSYRMPAFIVQAAYDADIAVPEKKRPGSLSAVHQSSTQSHVSDSLHSQDITSQNDPVLSRLNPENNNSFENKNHLNAPPHSTAHIEPELLIKKPHLIPSVDHPLPLDKESQLSTAVGSAWETAGSTSLNQNPHHTKKLPRLHCRLGITASKKIGNAVCRNRAKRRVRAMAKEVLTPLGLHETTYHVIVRHTFLTTNFQELCRVFKSGITHLNSKVQNAKSSVEK